MGSFGIFVFLRFVWRLACVLRLWNTMVGRERWGGRGVRWRSGKEFASDRSAWPQEFAECPRIGTVPEISRFFEVRRGSIPRRALGLVTEWASPHREELRRDWIWRGVG